MVKRLIRVCKEVNPFWHDDMAVPQIIKNQKNIWLGLGYDILIFIHKYWREMTIMQKATFAGGCFWCMVTPFEEQPGIGGIVSGYTGGHVENPTYEEVKTGTSGHYEVVEITFDPSYFLMKDCWNYIGSRSIQPTMAVNSMTEEASIARLSSIMMKLKNN